MGYRTFVSISVVQFGQNHNEKDFKKLIEDSDPCMITFYDGIAEFEDNNNNTLEEIVKLSAGYPGMILEAEIDGTIESGDDLRTVRIHNGKEETSSAEITYPPFQEIVTKDEKRRNAKAREVSYGRDDLLDVSEKMACEFCDAPIGEELCSVMADAAYRWLSTINPNKE